MTCIRGKSTIVFGEYILKKYWVIDSFMRIFGKASKIVICIEQATKLAISSIIDFMD